MEPVLARGIQGQSESKSGHHSDRRKPDERIQLLADASELLSRGTDYEATLDYIARLLVSNLACWCTIDLINDTNQIERVAAAHRDPAKLHLTQIVQARYPAKPTATRGIYRVIATQKSLLVPVMSYEEWARRADDPDHLRLIRELGSTSYMCIPLIAREKTVGAIMLLSGERTFTETDLETAEGIARRIAVAVENVLLFRRLQKTLDELTSTQEQLVQSSKMAALGVISSGLAHEINNPLTIVRYYLTRVEAWLPKAESSAVPREHLKKIDQAVERITKIVADVKEFSRQTSHMFSPVELKSLLGLTLLSHEKELAEEKIAIEKRFCQVDIYVLGDADRLQQVFSHVIRNARDAIRANGEPGVINFELKVVGGAAFLRISDNGVGLPADSRDRVFEPFFTTKEIGKSVGLGLAIAHGIVKNHRGSIEFYSQPGRGAEVTITLPLSARSKFTADEVTRFEELPPPQAFAP